MAFTDSDLGREISLDEGNEHIDLYHEINSQVGQIIKLALKFIPDSDIGAARNFFEAIRTNNAFIFKASFIKRFFEQTEKPDYFVVCLGGNIEKDVLERGKATVLVAGCNLVDQNRLQVMKGLENPVSEHPAKMAVQHLEIGANGEKQLYFTVK